jgi:hypothetical protein
VSSQPGIFKISRVLMALLALCLVVLSKLPTSHCHCHTKKATTQSRSECPFAKLRALAGAVHLEASRFVAQPLPHDPGQIVAQWYNPPVLERRAVSHFARGPPRLLCV